MSEKIRDKLNREMAEKSPMEAVKDDLFGGKGDKEGDAGRSGEGINDKLAREMEEKSPTQAIKDDLKGSR